MSSSRAAAHSHVVGSDLCGCPGNVKVKIAATAAAPQCIDHERPSVYLAQFTLTICRLIADWRGRLVHAVCGLERGAQERCAESRPWDDRGGGQRAAIPQPREPPLRCLEITQSEIPLPRLPDRNESRTSPSADGPTDTSALPPSRFSPPRICNWQGAISCGSAVGFCCRGAA